MRTTAQANTTLRSIEDQQISEQISMAMFRARGLNKKQEITELFFIFDDMLKINQQYPVLTDQQRDAYLDYLIP